VGGYHIEGQMVSQFYSWEWVYANQYVQASFQSVLSTVLVSERVCAGVMSYGHNTCHITYTSDHSET
jgi:hypothetical protein